MVYKINSIMFDTQELLKEYPILSKYNIEINTDKLNPYYSEAYITITTLYDIQELIKSVGSLILDENCITIYDDYIE